MPDLDLDQLRLLLRTARDREGLGERQRHGTGGEFHGSASLLRAADDDGRLASISRRQGLGLRVVTLWSGRCGRIVAGTAALAAVVAPAAGAARTAVPNPCRVVPGATISTAFGSKGASIAGVTTTRPDGAVKQSVCTFNHAGDVLTIYLSPHQPVNGSGGPPGMVLTKPAGLGTGASFAYDLNPAFRFTNITFTRGALDAGVHDNGKLPHQNMLALAKAIYSALPA